MRIEAIKYKIEKLSVQEKKDLIDFIKNSYSVFDDRLIRVNSCPCCHSKHIVKNGLRKGIQKYVCRDCNKNFNYKTNTVLSKIQKLNQWNGFVEDFISLNITSLKALKKKLKLSEQTVFNWRHKLLSAIAQKTDSSFRNEPIEFDETWFRISRKGRRNLKIENKKTYRKWRKNLVGDSDYNAKIFLAFGRESRMLDVHQSHTGRTSVAHMQNYFIPGKFKEVTVYSDKHVSYKSFFKSSNIPHEMFRGTDHISFENSEVHNQTVNSFTRGLKYFLNEHMRGVSTKYLNFYAKWYQFINESKVRAFEKSELKFDVTDEICDNIVDDRFGFELYRQSELAFARFLMNNGRTNFGDCKNHFYANKMAA